MNGTISSLVIIGLLCSLTTSGCTSLFETRHYITIEPANAQRIRVICPGQQNWMGDGMTASLYEVKQPIMNQTAVRTGRNPEWTAKLAIYPRDKVPQDSDVIEVGIGSTFTVKNKRWKVIDIKSVDRVILNGQEDCRGRFVQIRRSS